MPQSPATVVLSRSLISCGWQRLPTWPVSRGSSREHTESDLRSFLTWCAERGLDPLAARRPHLELYIRWMQEIRRFKPSTVSRRFSVAAGFYRTSVIDGLLEHSPAEHVRRPSVPAESPTLGFTHLQFEALLTAARESPHPCDFALVAMLGLLGLRIFEATGADITDLGEEHGHRVLLVCGKGTKVVLVPLPPAVGRAIDTAIGARGSGPILLNSRGARMDRHAATRRLRRLADAAGVPISRPHPHMLRHTSVTTMQMSGVASDASFPARRERMLPGLQYHELVQHAYQGQRQRAADLRCHHPVASGFTMKHPIRLRWITACCRRHNLKAQRRGQMPPPAVRRADAFSMVGKPLITSLLDLYRDGGDVQARLPLLSTWLGHVDPKSTYWYLQAVPELLALAAGRLEQAFPFTEPPA